jgi:threonyl-tRNA synthetase
MPVFTLPDGSERSFDTPTSALEVATDIGPGLAKAALGAKVDDVLVDLSLPIDHDCRLSIVTAKTRDGDTDQDALFLLRHSAAHVMAEAIQRLFPGAQLVYGPPVDQGFYYDIAFPEGVTVSSADFEKIEAEMKAIIKEDRPFTRYELPAEDGLTKLHNESSKYKVDNAERAVRAGSESLSWYATGEPGSAFEDLCRGPHLPSTGRIGAFKVMSIASSYWHGDENSDRLTRMYGTAFADKKAMKAHLELLDEAKKRDHRVLGKQLRLFHIDEQVGQGLVLWTPNGAVIRQELMTFIGEELRKQGYHQVFTPHIGKLDLYRTSGHFPYYQESQYTPIVDRALLDSMGSEGCSCGDLANRLDEGEIEGYLLKPMNCPHHIRIFASEPHSYRDLPVRLAEFGTVYRWEQSGEISGMTRVRGFTQDDAHLFCREDQVAEELKGCLSIVSLIFDALDMKDFRVRIGLRDPDSSKYVGDPANWDKAEEACRQAAESLGAPFTEEPGEAAFYGPKIDFVVTDVIGREWQLGTVQVDYNLPERFDLSYIGKDNAKHRPVMIHRAPFGSFERFVGVLIEHFAGAFPCWLAPEQVRVLPISEKTAEYADQLLEDLKRRGIRATLDDSSERIQAKIKIATEMKIPYLAVVGPRDAEADEVSIRAFGEDRNLGSIDRATCLDALTAEISSRGKTRLLSEFSAAE